MTVAVPFGKFTASAEGIVASHEPFALTVAVYSFENAPSVTVTIKVAPDDKSGLLTSYRYAASGMCFGVIDDVVAVDGIYRQLDLRDTDIGRAGCAGGAATNVRRC